MFAGAGVMPTLGDSNYVSSVLMLEAESSHPEGESAKKIFLYFDVPGLNFKDPLVSPAYAPSVLRHFPPSLLRSGTRDYMLSTTVYTHAQLVKSGIDAELHVWEGQVHCSFAQPVVDPAVPENREEWSVIVKFFDSHLGR
jgi:epsilon-lactone hydrolase